jgi:hypothetical protein
MTNIKIKDKVRFFRKGENGKWGEACKGIVSSFSYNQGGEPVFAGVRTIQEGEVTEVEQLLPIESNCARLVRY